MKRFICSLLIMAMIFSAVAIWAAEEVAEKPPFTTTYSLGYLTGDTSKVVTKDDMIGSDKASLSDTGVQIEENGSATFGFFSKFAMRSVTLTFEGASGTTTIDTGDNVYTTTEITGDGEYTLVFGENLGKRPQAYAYNNKTFSGYYRDFAELKGDKVVTVSTTGGMNLKEMSFEKDKTPMYQIAGDMGVPDITPEEKAIMTTIALDEKASVILVNGGRRYLDNNDTNMRPYEENGVLYIPINTLAKAFMYYVEDYPEKNYALLRSDTHEYVMLNGRQTVSTGVADPVEEAFPAIIYRDGKTLASVRYFAELAGETVIYKDGLIVIDEYYNANDIMNNDTMRKYIENKIAPFKAEKKVGKTYYVAANGGDDSNEGTILAPFKTIEKASKMVESGDTVIIRGGTYREVLRPAKSGTENSPITYKAAEGEKVVISALEKFDTWAKDKDGRYFTKMSWDLGRTRNQLFVDGEPLTEARHPNTPGVLPGESVDIDNRLYPVRGDMYRVLGAENRDLVRSATQLWQEEDYWNGGVFVGLFGYGYQMQAGIIEKSRPGELVIGDEKTSYWYTTGDSKFNWGYITGHRNALDVPGEWVRDVDGMLYVILPKCKTPRNSTIEAKKRQLTIDLRDREFINIEGIETIGGGATMNNSNMCMMNNVDMKYISHCTFSADHFAGYLDFDYSLPKDTGTYTNTGSYVPNREDKNGAPERGEVGVYIAGRDNIFVNSSIHYSGYAGLYLSGLYTYVENNEIADTGYSGSVFGGIFVMNRQYEDTSLPKGGHFIHNNTVYNGGNKLMYVSRKVGGGHTPYLPMDIGYNDFHDGILMSSDTGLVYQYNVNGGYDGVMSNEHHNYVYMTTSEHDFNPYSNGIYHDGTSFGFDSFKNQIFWTQEGSGFSGYPLFEQHDKNAPANFLQWDNNRAGYVEGGVGALDDSYFAEDRPFYAGCLQDVDYTKNYDRFISGKYGMQLNAKDAELSEGVTVDESGYAHFTMSGQYIKFNDVDFGETGNTVNFSARGNYTHTNDVVEVIVGDDIDTGDVYEIKTANLAPEADIPSRFVVTVTSVKGGVHDIYMRVKDYYSIQIGGISIHSTNLDAGSEFACSFAPGFFQEVGKSDTSGNVINTPPAPRLDDGNADIATSCLNATTAGWYVKYEDLVFTADSDAFVFASGSEQIWANQPVEVYIDGFDEEHLVAEFKSKGIAWKDKTAYIEELTKVVPAGVHDVYINFSSKDGYNGSSVVWTTAFLKVGERPERYEHIKVKIPGEKFDAELSTQNEEYPFRTEFMNPPNFTTQGITYTLPGTVAGYKEISIPLDATKFIINYAAEEGKGGQPIEVRIDDPESEPVATLVTEGKGLMKFNKVEIELEEKISAGKHDIYISFGGEKNSFLNTKLDWFGFND